MSNYFAYIGIHLHVEENGEKQQSSTEEADPFDAVLVSANDIFISMMN